MAFVAPAALALTSMGGTALGAGIAAGSAILGGYNQANLYNYQAGVAKLNSQVNLQNAAFEQTQGGVKALQSGERTAYRVGEIQAGQGASNLDVNRGSAPGIVASQRFIGQQDQNIIRTNAARNAYGYEVKSAEDEAQASAYESAASTSKGAGFIKAATSLLGGATSVADKWLQFGSAFGSGSTFGIDYGQAPSDL